MEQRLPELLRQPVELSPEQAVEERIETLLNDSQLPGCDHELLEQARDNRAPMKQYPDIKSFQEDCNNFHLFFAGGLGGNAKRTTNVFQRYAMLFPEETDKLIMAYHFGEGVYTGDEDQSPELWGQLFDAYQKMSLLVAETDAFVYRKDSGSDELSLDTWFLNR